ncbi:sugar transferase [Pseudoduganella ginsengisoli]|uniref:Sugar transferase n=1 Tax=Pseudoduganella ginsengisoli TaxID=1462440 RepID=A0A6L6PSU7_9BURK|nr:sugar transferase [Pseudoduganella ginsengisoli]MTW00507.1 sugar transferase [Pseudoduganella ginsengisoli]
MKRTIDFILAAAGLLVLALPVCIIYVLVRWKLGSPAFFRQTRPGLHGKPFELVKFRSMTDEVHKLDSERITPFGQFLRSTSLDEIPQLWNVLKGDMSLIGPRPLLMSYLPLYTPEQMRRHNVRPGISGWAQVNGRCAVSWEEKFRLDIWYVDNQSFWLDVKIFFLTIKKVLIRQNVVGVDVNGIPFTGTSAESSSGK